MWKYWCIKWDNWCTNVKVNKFCKKNCAKCDKKENKFKKEKE